MSTVLVTAVSAVAEETTAAVSVPVMDPFAGRQLPAPNRRPTSGSFIANGGQGVSCRGRDSLGSSDGGGHEPRWLARARPGDEGGSSNGSFASTSSRHISEAKPEAS